MSKDKPVLIITGGQIGDLEDLRSRISDISPAAIICADGGARHAHALGIIPHMIVGDMDSVSPDLLDAFAARGAVIRRHPTGKDETDTELALDAALDLNPSGVWVFGALGFRIDHTLANLSLLLKGTAKKIPVKLVDEWCEVLLATDTCTIKGDIGQTVSLLPLMGTAKGVTLTGFEYPLEEGTLSMEKPLGVSNRLISETATIVIESGSLVVIRYFRPGIFPS